MRNFSDTGWAGFSEEFLLHSWSLLTARSFPYTPDASFCEEVPFVSSCHFLVRSFSYISLAVQFSEEFPLHTSCFVYSWGVFLALLMLLLVRRFSYTPHALFIREEFLLHTSCYMYSWGISLTLLMLCLFVRSFSYTPDATFNEEFVLPSSC